MATSAILLLSSILCYHFKWTVGVITVWFGDFFATQGWDHTVESDCEWFYAHNLDATILHSAIFWRNCPSPLGDAATVSASSSLFKDQMDFMVFLQSGNYTTRWQTVLSISLFHFSLFFHASIFTLQNATWIWQLVCWQQFHKHVQTQKQKLTKTPVVSTTSLESNSFV